MSQPTSEPSSETGVRAKSDARHLDFLDSLRALSAFYVMMNHAYLTIPWEKSSRIAACLSVLQHGHFAVCFFIILSGFCLMLPTLQNGFRLAHGTGTFLMRRAWRIIPPYYFAVIFSLVLIVFFLHDKTGTHWDSALPVTTHSIVTHFLLMHDAFGDDMMKINYVFWSIAVEWRIYFFFPLLLLGWRFLGPIWTTALTVAAAYLFQEFTLYRLNFDLTSHFLALFALGMLSAAISFSPSPIVGKYRSMSWGWITLAAGACSGLVYYLAKSHHFSSFRFLQDEAFPDLSFGLFGASLLVYLSLRPNSRLRSLFNFKPLVFLGSFAYSTYLIHAPVLQVVWQYGLAPLRLPPLLTWLALVVIGSPVCLLAAYVFFLFCEKPFFSKKQRKATDRTLHWQSVLAEVPKNVPEERTTSR